MYDLLGYLLGALDAAEREEIERALESDLELREQLEDLRASLRPVDQASTPFEPSGSLFERTCNVVGGDDAVSARDRRWFFREQISYEHRSGFSRADLIVLAGVLVAMTWIFFPAIANSRFMAERMSCEDNLREIGVALWSYTDTRPDRRFPEIPKDGNRSFAGVFAPMLRETNMLVQHRRWLCPSARSADLIGWQMPTLAEIDQAGAAELTLLKSRASGSYGYNLGVIEDGVYRARRNQGAFWFALASDAPSSFLPEHQSDSHNRMGQNVLYEDGHVRFVHGSPNLNPDHPFLSNRGFVEAGRPAASSDDAVIGSSGMSGDTFLVEQAVESTPAPANDVLHLTSLGVGN